METNNMHQHCTEVETLMHGKLPFVTRYGITMVLIVLALIALILWFSDGIAKSIIEEIIYVSLEHITSVQ